MDKVWIYTLVSVLLVSAASQVGIVFLIMRKSLFNKIQTLLVSFAVGTLLGGAVFHLIPESFEASVEHSHMLRSSMLVLGSILFFFILEKYFHIQSNYSKSKNNIKSFGPLNLIADALHNFLDGILIAAAFKLDIHTGVVATLAVLTHELPQEIGDFAVLVQAGYTRKRALQFNLLSALTALIGGIGVLIFPFFNNEISIYILPLAAGGFLYIALADLVPELNRPTSIVKTLMQIFSIIAGLIIMWLLLDSHSLHH